LRRTTRAWFLPGVLSRTAYVLRSPDAKETPFPEVLSRYSEVGQSQGWLLHPNTELHIENAYYREGAPKHGIADFLGTEKAVYQVRPSGLRLVSVESGLAHRQRPADQLPVQELIGAARLHYRYYRYFFQIVFRQRAGARGAVLLGANSMGELDALAARLQSDSDAVCDGASPHCGTTADSRPCGLTSPIRMRCACPCCREIGWIGNEQ
jgi:hypothetical protein